MIGLLILAGEVVRFACTTLVQPDLETSEKSVRRQDPIAHARDEGASQKPGQPRGGFAARSGGGAAIDESLQP